METNNLTINDIDLDYLNENIPFSISGVETFLQKLLPEQPNKPKLPTLYSKTPSINEIEKYKLDLEKYQSLKSEYDELLAEYDVSYRIYRSLVVQYLKYHADFDTVPDQYKDKVWELAYVRGHSNGYGDIFVNLVDLVGIFYV